MGMNSAPEESPSGESAGRQEVLKALERAIADLEARRAAISVKIAEAKEQRRIARAVAKVKGE